MSELQGTRVDQFIVPAISGALGVIVGYLAHVLQTRYDESRKANRIRRALAYEMRSNFSACLQQHVAHPWFLPFLRKQGSGMAFLLQPEYILSDRDASSLRGLSGVPLSSTEYDRLGNDLHYLSPSEVRAIRRHYLGISQIRSATVPASVRPLNKNDALLFLIGVRNLLFARDTLASLCHRAGEDAAFREVDVVFDAMLGDARAAVFE